MVCGDDPNCGAIARLPAPWPFRLERVEEPLPLRGFLLDVEHPHDQRFDRHHTEAATPNRGESGGGRPATQVWDVHAWRVQIFGGGIRVIDPHTNSRSLLDTRHTGRNDSRQHTMTAVSGLVSIHIRRSRTREVVVMRRRTR